MNQIDWIKVEDELPPKDVKVLGILMDCYEGVQDEIEWVKDIIKRQYIELIIYSSSFDLFMYAESCADNIDSDKFIEYKIVTHWMSLPKFPDFVPQISDGDLYAIHQEILQRKL